MREMYDINGNSHLVPHQEVQNKLKSGWMLFKPAVTKTEKNIITTTTKRPKATMRITKAEAEVIKPYIEEDN